MNRFAATNESRIAAESVESRTASHSEGHSTSRIAVRCRKFDISAERSDEHFGPDEVGDGTIGRCEPGHRAVPSGVVVWGEREQHQARGPPLRPLEQLSDPLGRVPNARRGEEGLGLGLVEGQVGCSDFEDLPPHAPSAAGQPDLPTTRDGHLDPAGQKIDEAG